MGWAWEGAVEYITTPCRHSGSLGPPRALAYPGLRLDLGALGHEQLDDAQVPIPGSEMERRPFVLMGRRGKGKGGIVCRPPRQTRTHPVLAVHVGPFRQESLDGGQVALLGCFEQL